MSDLSRNKTKQQLLSEIENAINAVDFGSVEIYIQDKTVTQVSVRSITKTSIRVNGNVSAKKLD